MLRKTLLIGVPVLIVALLLAVVIVPARLRGKTPIETKAIGVWRETGSSPAYTLTIRRDFSGGPGAGYTVTYPRSFPAPFPAVLVGDEIHIWGENTQHVVWVVSYNERTDTVTVTRPGGHDEHSLRRVSN